MSKKLFVMTCLVLLLISSVILGFAYVQAIKADKSQPANFWPRQNTTSPTVDNGNAVEDTNNFCRSDSCF